MRISVCIGIVVALLAAHVWAAEQADDPVARVNGQAITQGELDRFARLLDPGGLAAQTGETQAKEVTPERRARALAALIDRRLLLAKARAVYMLDGSMERTLDAFAESEYKKLERRLGSKLKTVQLLSAQGLTVDEFKQLRVDQLLVAKLTWDEVYDVVTVSPTEVRRHYDLNREQYRAPKAVVYRQVFLAVGGHAAEHPRRTGHRCHRGEAQCRQQQVPGRAAHRRAAGRPTDLAAAGRRRA